MQGSPFSFTTAGPSESLINMRLSFILPAYPTLQPGRTLISLPVPAHKGHVLQRPSRHSQTWSKAVLTMLQGIRTKWCNECFEKSACQVLLFNYEWYNLTNTFLIINSVEEGSFLRARNQQCRSINFTLESGDTSRVISFLDCRLKVNDPQKSNIGIPRKSTHSDKYLDFNSAHAQ